MIKQIFLDLDDVLNEFTLHALAHVGCPIDPWDFSAYNPAFGYDIVTAANALHPTRNFTLEKFWSMFKREDWARMPKSRELLPLLGLCEHLVGRENICILTTPIDDSECLAGKLDWIHEHLPAWMHRQYLMGPQKWLCARADALLIDDSDKNVKEFRAYGGNAILMPRPWNCLHATSPRAFQYLGTALYDYFFPPGVVRFLCHSQLETEIAA